MILIKIKKNKHSWINCISIKGYFNEIDKLFLEVSEDLQKNIAPSCWTNIHNKKYLKSICIDKSTNTDIKKCLDNFIIKLHNIYNKYPQKIKIIYLYSEGWW